MQTFAERALEFYGKLGKKKFRQLPPGISVLNPYGEPKTFSYTERFINTFFADNKKRFLAFGINPGRLGGGATGINFTDPTALAEECGVENDMPKTRELSSQFVYELIRLRGGPKKFYGDFFLTAVSPLGFTRDGVNYNYYDDKKLLQAVRPFIIEAIRSQIELGARTEAVVVFGTGKNKEIFGNINREYGFFKKVCALEHPRFVMQYRRREISKYLQKYNEVFSRVLSE